MSPNRRTFLAVAAAAALAPAFAVRARAALPQAVIRRYGDFFIVDGWVLTQRDLDALGLHAR